MQQRFILPENCGVLQAVSYVNVKPQFQQEVVGGHVMLTGVYLIQVELTRVEGKETRATDGIVIEEVDLDGDVAYFEYGLPLNRKLAGEGLVEEFRMEPIEGVILPGGVLEIQAKEHITRKPEIVAAVPKPEKKEQPMEPVAMSEPVAMLLPEKTVEMQASKSVATGIVAWLGLSNHYKTEKVQLNPILKQSEANRTEDKQ